MNIPFNNNVFQIALNKVIEDKSYFRNMNGSSGIIENKYILENIEDNIYTFEVSNKENMPIVYRYYDEIEYKHMTDNLLEVLDEIDNKDIDTVITDKMIHRI